MFISKSLLIIIIGAGAVIIGLGAYITYEQRAEPVQLEIDHPSTIIEESNEIPMPKEPRDKPVATEEAVIDTSNWLTYRDGRGEYEIKYPRDVIVAEESAGTRFSPPAYEGCPPPGADFAPYECPLFMFITVQEADPEQSLDDWLTERLARFWAIQQLKEFKITAEESNYGLDCVEKTTIGKGISAWRIHSWSQAWGQWDYYAKNLNQVATIQIGGIGLSCSDPIDPLFTQMIQTFRFLR